MELINILIVGLGISILVIVYRLFTPSGYKEKRRLRKTQEKEEEEKMKKRLDDPRLYDPRLYDPETNTYITLEQAESGMWDVDDPKSKMSKEEIKENFSEEQLINHTLREEFVKEGFKRIKEPFSEEQYEQIEKFELLKQFEDWSYNDHFKKGEITAILLSIQRDTLISMWIRVKDITGHYIFKEKTTTDRILDKIRPDDDIQIENYECFTIQKTKTTRAIENIIATVNKYQHIEVEIQSGHLFIKTTRPARLTDLLMLLNLSRNIVQNGY